MSAEAVIRRLEAADVEAAAAVAVAAFEPMTPEEHRTADAHRRMCIRVAHLARSDPEGSWVAERDGEVVAVALAIVREGVWGLSLLVVRPGLQGQGLGGRVLAPALEYAEGTRGGIILSSTDPRAMRRYFRAGFRLRPCVAAAGNLNRSRLPAGLRSRPGDPEADAELLHAASRRARTAAHGDDVVAALRTGGTLFVLDGRGYAVARDGAPILLAADDDEAASDLMWTCLASGEAGGAVHVDFVTEGNDWAVAVALDAGLALSPDGPMFVRGETGPMAPYLPNGSYL